MELYTDLFNNGFGIISELIHDLFDEIHTGHMILIGNDLEVLTGRDGEYLMSQEEIT